MRPTDWLANKLRRRPSSGSASARAEVPDGPERTIGYDGVCNLCGYVGRFETTGNRLARAFRCPRCNAALRARNEAAAILEEIGRGRHLSLKAAIGDDTVRSVAVYNVGSSGPVRRWLSELPDYTESARYVEGVPCGPGPDGSRNEDLQNLTFDDESFDLVTSSHVMEHVADPTRALEEIHRVLRPGGRYVFSVPVRWPPPDESVVRCAIVDGELVHYRDPAYHGSPTGEPTLVFTDFGTDLLDTLERIGFLARHTRPHLCVELAYRDSVFVATKPKVG